MTSSSKPHSRDIETLSPHIHGFVRAFVWQLQSEVEPQLGDEPDHESALSVARVIMRVAPDRVGRSQLVKELGEYLRRSDRTGDISEALRRLIVEIQGGHNMHTSRPAPVATPAKVEVAPEPKVEAAPEPKVEAVPEPKVEAAPEPKVEAEAEPPADSQAHAFAGAEAHAETTDGEASHGE